jgi:hypothetical protein
MLCHYMTFANRTVCRYYVCIHVCIYVCMHLCMYLNAQICTRARPVVTHIHTYIQARPVVTHIHTYIQARPVVTHIHTHTHTHTFATLQVPANPQQYTRHLKAALYTKLPTKMNVSTYAHIHVLVTEKIPANSTTIYPPLIQMCLLP